MQDYGVNLICVEDGIDSSKEAGKLLISIIATVAEDINVLFDVTLNSLKLMMCLQN